MYYSITNFIYQKLTDGQIYGLGVDSYGNIFRAQEDKVYKITPSGLEILMSGLERGRSARALVIDDDDNVYVGSDNGCVYKSDGVHDFVKIILSDSRHWISCLAINKETGMIYAGNDIGVYSIDQIGDVRLISGTNHEYIRSLAVGPDDSIYAGIDHGGRIYKTNGKNGNFQIFQQKNEANQIDSLVVDKENTVYAGAWNGNLYKINNGRYDVILETNPSHEIKCLVIDRENNLFAGIDSNKVYEKVKDTDWLYELSGIKNTNDHILALAVGPDDSIYAAGSQGILYTAKNFN